MHKTAEELFNNGSFLVVDCDCTSAKKLVKLIKSAGVKNVCDANSANDGWSLLQIKHFDCVISAWEMPEMSGIAFLKIVRSDDRFFNLPFYLFNENYTKVSVLRAGEAGVSGLLVKPFDLAYLRSKIDFVSQNAQEKNIEDSDQKYEEGLLYVENGDFSKALGVFKSLVGQGESAEVYYNIGYIKTAQEKYDEAIIAFRKATQIDRLFAKAYEAMGRVYRLMGKKMDAQSSMQKAAEIYINKHKIDDAEGILNEILEFSPEAINVFNSFGVIYRKRGEYNTALNYYEKALKIHPKEASIYYNIGRLYLEMKTLDRAKTYFTKALKLNPQLHDAQEILTALEIGTL